MLIKLHEHKSGEAFMLNSDHIGLIRGENAGDLAIHTANGDVYRVRESLADIEALTTVDNTVRVSNMPNVKTVKPMKYCNYCSSMRDHDHVHRSDDKYLRP